MISSEPSRILITKLKQVGDVLLATPAIASLRAAFPAACIYALVPRNGAEVLAGNPHLDGVLVWDRGVAVKRRVLQSLRALKPDWVVQLGLTRRERMLGVVSGARRRAGFAPGGYAVGLTDAVEFDWGIHVVVNAARLLSRLGLNVPPGPLHLQVAPADLARVRSLLGRRGVSPGQPLAIVHPVTRWLFKSARDETIAAVIEGLGGRHGLAVAITAGPRSPELERAQRIAGMVRGRVVDLAGEVSLGELAALLSMAFLVVTVDGAPMHMAAALQIPQVALFGPTREANWAPWQAPHALIAAPFLCRPCGRDGCLGSKVSDCLQELKADQILAAAAYLLASRPVPSPRSTVPRG